MKSKKFAVWATGVALAFTATVGATSIAYAADGTTSYEHAVITKELATVPGQALTEEFKFKFEAYNDTTNVDPVLAPATVTIQTNSANAVYKFDPSTAKITYFANTDDLMTQIKDKFTSAKDGIYEYKVTEDASKATDKMTYDDSVYFLRVIKKDGQVTTQVIKADPSKNKPGSEKVDPTADKDRSVTSTGDGSTEYKGSDFAFKNSYKTGDNAVTDGVLTLKKLVAGLEAGGTSYSFTVKFTTPDADKAALITAAGENGAASTFENDGHGGFTVTLRKDEDVKFSNIQEGTIYSVTETSTGEFTPSAAITTTADLTGLPAEQAANGSKGSALTVDYTATHKTVIGSGENKTDVTNTYPNSNPTGVIINNLPFVLMVGIPVVAAAGYVVSRRKVQN